VGKDFGDLVRAKASRAGVSEILFALGGAAGNPVKSVVLARPGGFSRSGGGGGGRRGRGNLWRGHGMERRGCRARDNQHTKRPSKIAFWRSSLAVQSDCVVVSLWGTWGENQPGGAHWFAKGPGTIAFDLGSRGGGKACRSGVRRFFICAFSRFYWGSLEKSFPGDNRVRTPTAAKRGGVNMAGGSWVFGRPMARGDGIFAGPDAGWG